MQLATAIRDDTSNVIDVPTWVKTTEELLRYRVRADVARGLPVQAVAEMHGINKREVLAIIHVTNRRGHGRLAFEPRPPKKYEPSTPRHVRQQRNAAIKNMAVKKTPLAVIAAEYELTIRHIRGILAVEGLTPDVIAALGLNRKRGPKPGTRKKQPAHVEAKPRVRVQAVFRPTTELQPVALVTD